MSAFADQTIAAVGEDALVQMLTAGLPQGSVIHTGPGDDCAVLGSGNDKLLRLLKTDCVIEAVHYTPETAPEAVGWKALARAVSDIAAMGGWAEVALVTIALPGWRRLSYAKSLYDGILRCAHAFDISIAGGETTRSPGDEGWLSVSLTGWVEAGHLITRSGGCAGDALFVTGKLGGSFYSGRHLNFMPRMEQARWLAAKYRPTAMMDISDGLASDLPRMARSSNCGFQLNQAAIPLHVGITVEQALHDGEDYELLFSLSPSHAHELEREWGAAFPELALTRIGNLVPIREGDRLTGGWDPFETKSGI